MTKPEYGYGLRKIVSVLNILIITVFSCIREWLCLGQYILKHSEAKGHDNINIFSNISEKNGERIKQMGQNINNH